MEPGGRLCEAIADPVLAVNIIQVDTLGEWNGTTVPIFHYLGWYYIVKDRSCKLLQKIQTAKCTSKDQVSLSWSHHFSFFEFSGEGKYLFEFTA